MASFRDLSVWQESMNLAVDVFKITEQLPRYEELGLGSQLRRSAVSIPSNIAEGWGRRRNKEFRYFLGIAYGSVCELETQLELVERCHSLNTKSLGGRCVGVQRQIHALKKSLESETD